jgi:UDP-glucose 4-epimerase
MMKRTLVTGGAGFIGSHVVEALRMAGQKILVVDNLTSGSINNLSSIINEIDFEQKSIETIDLSQFTDIQAVIHLAAQTSVPLSIESFKSSSIKNSCGTINVIDFCRKNAIPLVYASSAAVYGGLPYGDDASTTVDLMSPYAVDKHSMELYARCAYNLYGLSSIGLRFFNVYGPRQDPLSAYSGVITVFLNQLLQGKDVTLNGGYQTRDFIYVADVVNCIINAYKYILEKKYCDVINVLTGVSITIKDLLNLLVTRLDARPIIHYNDLPKGDAVESGGSIKKLREVLHISVENFIELRIGLEKMIDYFESVRLNASQSSVII